MRCEVHLPSRHLFSLPARAMTMPGEQAEPGDFELVEPSFECVAGELEVQFEPLLGSGAFGTLHYAVLRSENRTVALKAVSKAATRQSAIEGGATTSIREILYGEAMLLEELAKPRHRNMLKFVAAARPPTELGPPPGTAACADNRRDLALPCSVWLVGG